MESVAIVHCGGADVTALSKLLIRAGRDRGLNLRTETSGQPEVVSAADRVILAGCRNLQLAMGALAAAGLIAAIEHAVLVAKRPFLGIGAGMDALAEADAAGAAGLDWIAGAIAAGDAVEGPLLVRSRTGHPVLASLDHRPDRFVFETAGRFEAENDAHVLAVADEDGGLAAVVGRDNILGVRFRPELSGAAGLALLGDFLAWRP